MYEQIKKSIDESKVAHIDETEFKQNNRSGWAWIIANECFSFLQLEYSMERKLPKS